MLLFRKNHHTLTAIERAPFHLEKDIQLVVERNLETLFNLVLVSSEFSVGSFRLDTLAFDEETQSFAIIEYKKGHSYSVVDQGYSYLSVMVNNKADFILEYNERLSKSLRRDDVDWSASKVIFIAPSFNAYQRNSVNFQDVPFELWEIRQFEEGIVAFEQCKPTSSESIETVSKPASSLVIKAVSAEVKVLAEKDHVAQLDDSLKAVWVALRERITDYPDSSFFVSKGYISWKRDNTAVCFIHFQKKVLRIDVLRGNKRASGETSKGYFTLDDPKALAKDRSWTWKTGQTGHAYSISVSKEKDLDYVMFLLEQKYKTLE